MHQNLNVFSNLLIGTIAWFFARDLDVLSLVEEALFFVDFRKIKFLVMELSYLIAGNIVAFVVMIGFVDLIIFHVIRCYFGANHCLVILWVVLLDGSRHW